MKVTTYEQAMEYIYSVAQDANSKYTSAEKFKRTKYFFKLCGNPQDALRVVHVAGTSGKGSTTKIVATLLRAHGYCVGSTFSPHLYTFLERFQINNTPISEKQFVRYLNNCIPWIEQMKQSKWGAPSWLEMVILLASYIFFKENVDFAVFETGMGGRFDATNVFHKQKVNIITRIGLDHTEFLGDTIEKIAGEKAGIIHKNDLTINLVQNDISDDVISERAKNANSKHINIREMKEFELEKQSQDGIVVSIRYKTIHLAHCQISLHGGFQAENATLALAGVYELFAQDGEEMNPEKTRKALGSVTMGGRFQIIPYKHKQLILDGAHNEQKMEAFLTSIKTVFPDKKFTFLISFKKGKDVVSIVKKIIPFANRCILTDFLNPMQGMFMESVSCEEVERIIKSQNRNIPLITEPDYKKAVDIALNKIDGDVVITGSLYLLANMYHELENHDVNVKKLL